MYQRKRYDSPKVLRHEPLQFETTISGGWHQHPLPQIPYEDLEDWWRKFWDWWRKHH
ncbi:hypothetical protein [Paenibacillus silviterrae]|uniref:hypothetical protein n=1 Tax=Paenibacillus silviterrae TaxID=3242194 RepID=UPI00254382D1|nr:hypothetical protein [Paenibacillus chinjuensis]